MRAEPTAALDWALAYARAGYHVFPLHSVRDGACSCGCQDPECRGQGKHPRTQGGHIEATTDLETITDWWTGHPGDNIGISCLASGIVAVDVDPRNGGDESLLGLTEAHGNGWLDTVSASTGGGGEHHLFLQPSDVEGKAITSYRAKLSDGIDIKANGYIVVAPSSHRSGRFYEWNADRSPLDRTPAEMPSWLIEKVRSQYEAGDYEPRPWTGPPADLETVLIGCSWIAHCRDDARTLAEPDWYAMLGIVARCHDGTATAHAWSQPHSGYTADDTDTKIAHAVRDAGPATCAFIEDRLGWDGCAACRFHGRVRSPIVLGNPTRLVTAAENDPIILVSGRPTRDVAADAWKALEAANSPVRYATRGKGVVRIVEGSGTVRLDDLGLNTMRYELDRVGRWLKQARVDGEWKTSVASPIPRHIVEDVLAHPSPPLPVLEGIAVAPFFGRDGQLVSKDGYDAPTRIFLSLPDSLRDLTVPSLPTEEEVHVARVVIEDMLCDFPFVSSADRANAWAMLLTPFLRPMFDDITPLFAVVAPTRGSGKGLLVDTVTIPAAGTPSPRTTITRRGDEELTKKLFSLFLEGRQFLHIDNVTGILTSPVLEAVLTADQYTERILGRSEAPSLKQRMNWAVSGNNLSFGGDLPRRVVPIRIAPALEQPELRTGFRHPELLSWVSAHRREIVGACLTLIQAWVARGMPPGREVMGSYQRWATSCGGVLKVAGIDGFLQNRDEVFRFSDTQQAALREFVSLWADRLGTQPVPSGSLFDLVSDLEMSPIALGEGSDRSQRTRFGTGMRSLSERIACGYRITFAGEDKKRGSKLWQLCAVEGSEPVRLSGEGSDDRGPGSDAETTTQAGRTAPDPDDFGTFASSVGTFGGGGSDEKEATFRFSNHQATEPSERSEPFYSPTQGEEEKRPTGGSGALRTSGARGSEGSDVQRITPCRCPGCDYCQGPAAGAHSRLDLHGELARVGMCRPCLERRAA